jgi:hypothetical protein
VTVLPLSSGSSRWVKPSLESEFSRSVSSYFIITKICNNTGGKYVGFGSPMGHMLQMKSETLFKVLGLWR